MIGLEILLWVLLGVFILSLVYFYLVPSVFLKFLGFIFCIKAVRLRVFGDDNIPESGPLLLVSNHISMLDLMLLQYVCKRRIHFLVNYGAYNFFTVASQLIFRFLRVSVVPPGTRPRALLNFYRDIRKMLRDGEVICYFPEGGISSNGNLKPFRSGVKRFVADQGVDITVLPVRIGMLHGRLLSRRDGRYKFTKLHLTVDFSINIGAPIAHDLSKFQLRQKISELGAEAEARPQPGEMPFHTAYMKRAKSIFHFGGALFIDADTGKKMSNLSGLVGAIILSKIVRNYNRGDSKYVGVLMPNCTAAAAIMLGVLYADKTPAMVNYSVGQDVAMGSMQRAGIKTIFTSKLFLMKLKWEVTEEMVFLEDIAPTITKTEKLLTLLRVIFTPFRMLARQVAPNSCFNMHYQAVLLFSSGTTGTPKGVMLSHRNINCDLWSFYRLLGDTSSDKIVGNLPLFHAFGFCVGFAISPQLGIPTIFIKNPLAASDIVKAIAKYKMTILTSTPTFLQSYLRKATSEDLKSLRLVVTGAEKLRKEIDDQYFGLTGKHIIEGYGCTELSPIATVNFNDDVFDSKSATSHPGSIGCPLPGIHVRIIDEDGVELEPKPSKLRRAGADENLSYDGRMQVKAGTVMLGYLNDLAQTSRVIQNGYYDTGDIAHFDEDGYLYITGRASRFSKVGGEMVPHEAIEDAISHVRPHAECREVAVTSRSDTRKGEKIIVFYTPDDFNPEGVVEAIRKEGKLPNVWIPKPADFHKIAELPILGSGKLNLKKLKEEAENLPEA